MSDKKMFWFMVTLVALNIPFAISGNPLNVIGACGASFAAGIWYVSAGESA